MFRTISLVIVLATAAFGQESAKDEAQVWNLEKAYWEYVKANDLEKYRALWHEDFVRLALCERVTCADRSHYRLDHGQHVEGREVAVILD
jgi:hypothetical protein